MWPPLRLDLERDVRAGVRVAAAAGDAERQRLAVLRGRGAAARTAGGKGPNPGTLKVLEIYRLAFGVLFVLF